MHDPDESPPPFTPVPGRARHDGWTPDRQRAFVAALGQLGAVRAAAKAVGMSGKSAYALRHRAGEESEFARAWDAVLERAYGAARDYALPLALRGDTVPVFYGGRQIGERRRHHTRLAMAILNAEAARRVRPGGGR